MRLFSLILFLLLSTLSCLALSAPANQSPLANIKVSQGAAAGYVEDTLCSQCHLSIYDSYQAVGMSKSFTTPSPDKFIENFDSKPFYHEQSQRYYQVAQQGTGLQFKRWQLDNNGNKINELTQPIDYILGSGHKARSYLYRSPSDELFQLPIGWYTEIQAWGMSPGYDNATHVGVNRQVHRQCLFCHNAFPEVPQGSDQHDQPHFFPETLPHGTGCQRCHGPGAEHIKTVLSGTPSIEAIRNAIVNPAKLPVKERDSVCFQCHLLPSVDLVGVRSFDRADYSFRPGENINDYIHHVDVVDEAVAKSDRFEINHHAYRLRQSDCFAKSEGELTCISCHNPHQKVPKPQRAEHYATQCLSCHQDTNHKEPLSEKADCVSCHMPQRRTQDVVNVTMTDHRIGIFPKDKAALLAPLQEQDPEITELDFLMAEQSPQALDGEIYKVVTVLRSSTQAHYVDYLQKLLEKRQPKSLTPYADLLVGQLRLKRYNHAIQTASWILSNDANHRKALEGLATALIATKQYPQANAIIEQAIKMEPKIASLHFNYALLAYSQQQWPLAQARLKQAVALQPNLAKAWIYLARVNTQLQQPTQAIQHLSLIHI